METVRLKRTARLLAGHLWVFSNELITSPKGFDPGSLVEVSDRKNAFLGIGYINPHSLIAVRILTREKEEINPDFFRRRILGAIEYRKRLMTGLDSFRVIFSEGDLLPGLIVDKYSDCLVVQCLTAGMEKWEQVILDMLDEFFSPSLIVLRNDSPFRAFEGLMREKRVVKGVAARHPILREGGLRFEIDPMSGQKTGFFLDQRENRAAFSKLIGGGKGLDLFCYVGAWGVHLAYRGAEVTCIDESGDAIDQARRNADLNGLSESCKFTRADVFEFLNYEVSQGNAYDFIVLDPPAFVKSKAKVKEALRGYRELNTNAMRLLVNRGLLATSSCSYHIDKSMFVDMLSSAARDAGRQVRLVELRSQARDHPILLRMPETEYLKCAFLEVQ